MHNGISLTLELLDNTVENLTFRLRICNQSDSSLLLPYPGLTGFRFINKSTLEESKWGGFALIEGGWGGLAITPGETRQIDYCLAPFCFLLGDWEGAPLRWDGKTFGDEIDMVELPTGNYLVWYQMEVGPDYFDGVSHYRFRDIQREAQAQEAVAWTGVVKSNRLQLFRA